MKENLKKAFDEASKLGSYFITITTRDREKTENDLKHSYFQEEFPIDNIVPSIDKCVSLMNIKNEVPLPVVEAPKIDFRKKKPLKIAIITHFNQAPNYYSPARAVKNQVKMLKNYCNEVVFFTQEGSKMDVGCEMRAVVPKFRREKNVVNKEAKDRFVDVLRRELTDDFDIAITHDLYIDDCITYREAIKECGVDIEWLHWARSGVGRRIDFNMPNARYVYMNKSESVDFARNISIPHDRVRVVYNDKDPGIIFDWDETTEHIVNSMKLWEKDIVQAYPMCTTRMDAKGINSVITVFAKLKEMGNKVCLIIPNANGRKRLDEIEAKYDFAKNLGLIKGEDIIFTSTLHTDKINILNELPHKNVIDLLQMSNLFVFASSAEVCSNVLLEASMTNNLIVINEDLISLVDFVKKGSVLSYPFTSRKSVHYKGREGADMRTLAKEINGQIKANKADQQFRHVWRTHRLEAIYENMLAPILFESMISTHDIIVDAEIEEID